MFWVSLCDNICNLVTNTVAKGCSALFNELHGFSSWYFNLLFLLIKKRINKFPKEIGTDVANSNGRVISDLPGITKI